MPRGRTSEAHIATTGLPAGTPVARCRDCDGSIVTLPHVDALTEANTVCEHCGAYYVAVLRVSLAPAVSSRSRRSTMTVMEIREATSLQLGEGHLALLKRIIRARRDNVDRLNDAGLRLVDRAIFAALTDCIDAGLGDNARAVLRRARLRVTSTAPARGSSTVSPGATSRVAGAHGKGESE